MPFEQSYPCVTYVVKAIGWIEVGHDAESPLTSFIRAIDPGGMVWEGKDAYQTLDEAFHDAEEGLAKWMRAQGIAER